MCNAVYFWLVYGFLVISLRLLMHGQGTRFSFTGPLFNQSIRLHAMLNSINYQCRFEFRVYVHSVRSVRSVHSRLGPIHRMNEKKIYFVFLERSSEFDSPCLLKKELHKHRLLRIENVFRYTWNVESRWEHRAKDRIIALYNSVLLI